MILEFVVLFVLCFERVTEYAPRLRKRHDKLLRRSDKSGEAIKKRLKIRNLKDFVKWCLAERKVYRYARRTVLILNPFLLFLMLELLNGTFQKNVSECLDLYLGLFGSNTIVDLWCDRQCGESCAYT